MVKTHTKEFYISWDEIQRYSMALGWRLGNKAPSGKPWQGIIAVARGGMFPAAIVARVLGVRLIETICLQTYSGKKPGAAKLIRSPEVKNAGQDWLIIDDLVDTGRTAQVVRKLLPRAHFATLYAKPKGLPYVDTFLMEFSQDTWIYFPWEVQPKFQAED